MTIKNSWFVCLGIWLSLFFTAVWGHFQSESVFVAMVVSGVLLALTSPIIAMED